MSATQIPIAWVKAQTMSAMGIPKRAYAFPIALANAVVMMVAVVNVPTVVLQTKAVIPTPVSVKWIRVARLMQIA